MRCSVRASAPVLTMISRSWATPASSRAGSPRPASSAAAAPGSAVAKRGRDQVGPLAFAQVVAGRLAGGGRVAEHAEHVVAQLERLADRQPVAGVGGPDEVVGIGHRGAEHPADVTDHFHYLANQAGLPPIRLHDLRHGAATLALAAGVEMKLVQEMLRHSSITITSDTYTNSRELHQAGEKPQVARSRRRRNGAPTLRVTAA